MMRGLSVVDPAARRRHDDARADAHRGGVGGRDTDRLSGSRTIPSGPRRITLSYAGLSLGVPERVRFRYRLDGFDSRLEPSGCRAAGRAYTNLGPGSYRFRVKASNSDGLWNGSRRRSTSTVEPTLWQTAWFRVSALRLFGLAGGACIACG